MEDPAIVVFSTADKDEIGIRTLVGDYKEEGTNHGRKFYKKMQKSAGHENIDVFLYFWDNRDGPDFSGWWFGNQVGGAQVWSRNKVTGNTPPKSGWTIPWDGEVKKELMVMSGQEKRMRDQNQAKTQQVQRIKEEETKAVQAVTGDWEERVQKSTERVATVEVDTTQFLEDASDALEGGDVDEIKNVMAQMAQHMAALAETQRAVAVETLAAQKAPPALKAEMMALGQRVRELQNKLKEEHTKLKNAAAAVQKTPEQEEREREMEAQQSRQLEEMMPTVMEKVDNAEDEVEKCAIAAAPLKIDSSDDMRPVMLQAVKETEQRVRSAQAAIGEARRLVTAKITSVQRFSPSIKKAAVDEFTALQTRLNEAQEKLNPFKNVRMEYEQRAQSKKLYEELSSKLAGAEIEVEKAAMMTAPLGGDSAEGIKETESALTAAQSALSQCSRLIESKLKTASVGGKTAVVEDIKSLQDRSKLAQEKLDEVRKAVKETQVRMAADTLLQEVTEKVSAAEDELQQMSEAELPLMRGDVSGNLDELIQEAEKAASKVHAAMAEAQTFVARKMVEVARYTEGPAKAVKEEMEMMQKRLDEGRDRLAQFKVSLNERKRSFILQDIENKVGIAESEVQKMTEATDSINTIGIAGDVVTETLKDTVDNANLAEREAQAAIVIARKTLLQKTAELKKIAVSGASSGTELGKLQTRVNNMQAEISKLRNATKNAEERIRVKQLLAEVAVRLQTAEGDVDKVSTSVLPDTASPEELEKSAKATKAAGAKLGATAKLVDIKLKSAQGFLKEELQGMRARISVAEKKLGDVVKMAKASKEKLLAAELLTQAASLVDKAELTLQQASAAELPFLKGIEVLAARDAMTAIAESEQAIASTQKSITEARAFVVKQLAEVKEFTEGPQQTATQQLNLLQKKLDASATKLAEMKRDTAERKRRTQMQASTEKISSVEEAVQKLATVMSKFSDDKLTELSADAARDVCEEIANTEQDAQDAVSAARKFLALRTQEAKGLTESQRAPMTADLAKLQSRLTQCQVELAKLSRQCSEREQRYVAKRLVLDATAGLERTQAEVEHAGKVAAPLMAEDSADLLKECYLQSMVDALLVHQQAENLSIEALASEVVGGKSAASSSDVIAFLDKIPGEVSLTAEQVSAIFSKLAPDGRLTPAQLKHALRSRYVCSSGPVAFTDAEGGRELGSIEEGEGIEVLETKDDKSGNKIAHCILARDGAAVWTTISTSAGDNFTPAPPSAGRLQSMMACVTGVHNRCTETAEQADKKTVEVSGVKHGPLAEIKTKLLQLRTGLSKEQAKIDQLMKKAEAAKNSLAEQQKAEMHKAQEAKVNAFASKAVKEAATAVEAAEEQANKCIMSNKSGSAEKLRKELSTTQLQELKKVADSALRSLADAKASVTKGQDGIESFKGVARSLLLEARMELTKLNSRVTASERKLKEATEAVRSAYTQMAKAATQQARSAMRAAARKTGKSTEDLFKQVSGGKDEITEKQLQTFVKKLDSGLTEDQVRLVYNEVAPFGLRAVGFAKAMQEYCTCTKRVAITATGPAVEGAKTVRTLNAGETFEVLEGPVEDPASKVSRVKGRALRDGATGWVTVQGAQGTPFLRPSTKPYMCVGSTAENVGLRKSLDAPAAIRDVQVDEVLELLEGPREETGKPSILLRGKASKDSAEGWITMQSSDGTTFAEASKDIYVCKSTIAMTDGFDIKKCKVTRKVEVGETLQVIGGRKEDSNVEITRLQFRAVRDGKEGWVTLKGNQGTIFMEPSPSHYVVKKVATLRQDSEEGSEEVRQLEVGEAFEAEGAPEEVQPEMRLAMQARALSDGQTGWLSFPASAVALRPWGGKYTCKAPTEITPAVAVKGAKALRRTVPGEAFEAVEGPTLDAGSGLRRVRVATAADGIIGWASLRDSDGDAFLEVA